jgi:hypothetical protein
VLGQVAAGFARIVEESSEAEQNIKLLDLAFRRFSDGTGITRKQLDDFASSVQSSTGFTDDAVSQMQTTLLRFGAINKDNFKQLQMAVIDLSAAMGSDLQSAAFSLGRAMADPERGLRLLRMQGIVLTEQQEKLIKSFNDVGDAAGSQKIILDAVTKTYGGTSKELSTTFNESLKRLRNELAEIIEQPGLLPKFSEGMRELADVIRDSNLKEGIGGFAEAVDYLSTKLIRGNTELYRYLAAVKDIVKELPKEAFNAVVQIRSTSQPFPSQGAGFQGFGGAFTGPASIGNASLAGDYYDLLKYGAAGSPMAPPTPPQVLDPKLVAQMAKEQAALAKMLRESTQAANDFGAAVGEAIGGQTTGVEEFKKVMDGVDDFFEKQREKGDQARDYRNKQIEESLQDAKAQAQELESFSLSAGNAVQQAFASAFMDVDQGLRGMVQGFVQAFKQIIAQAAAMDLAKFLGLGKLFSGGGSGTATGAILKGIGGMFGFKAGGGYGSGLTMVGEEGPELVNLPGGSRVFNAREIAFNAQRMGKTAPITVTQNNVFNNTGAVTQEQLAAVMARSSRELARGMLDAQQRNRGLA